MRHARTTQPPLINVMRPGYRKWIWSVHIDVNSNGYVETVSVAAAHVSDGEHLLGRAVAPIELGDDLHEAIEQLAIEACLNALEEALPGLEKPARRLKGPFERRELTASRPGGRL